MAMQDVPSLQDLKPSSASGGSSGSSYENSGGGGSSGTAAVDTTGCDVLQPNMAANEAAPMDAKSAFLFMANPSHP
jgi:hypothetical protein